ncbi:MAG: [NiFe] hydrogenase metallocenter assembly protein HypC, partial [uncultured Solirubrobacteraceae bacterium]
VSSDSRADRRMGRRGVEHRQGAGRQRAAQRQRRPAGRDGGRGHHRRLGAHPRRLCDVEDRRGRGAVDEGVPRAAGRSVPRRARGAQGQHHRV